MGATADNTTKTVNIANESWYGISFAYFDNEV